MPAAHLILTKPDSTHSSSCFWKAIFQISERDMSCGTILSILSLYCHVVISGWSQKCFAQFCLDFNHFFRIGFRAQIRNVFDALDWLISDEFCTGNSASNSLHPKNDYECIIKINEIAGVKFKLISNSSSTEDRSNQTYNMFMKFHILHNLRFYWYVHLAEENLDINKIRRGGGARVPIVRFDSIDR